MKCFFVKKKYLVVSCLIAGIVIDKDNISLFISALSAEEAKMKISEFQNLIGELYQSRDEKRGADKTFLWFLEEVGELTRSYRRGEKENVGKEMADVFAWLVSVANLLNVDLESEIQEKYPKVCPLCSSSPCCCPWI
jgi:NTP pyrophosphatase (non-canonical NTP hydrolase)